MTIELVHIEKSFPSCTPIKDLSAKIYEGDIIAIIGPSGTGKTTLIRCIDMLTPPNKGQIYLDGEEITAKHYNLKKLHHRIGMVFQTPNLFDHLTVIENIMLALTKIKKMSRQEAYDTAMACLDTVGLADQALKYPESLSLGQAKRVAIARTLAMDPEVILFDEPIVGLDPKMVREVEDVIKHLAKTGKTMMIVTHSMRFAKSISNRVFYLDQGTLYEEGTPEQIFENPKRERTYAFINGMRYMKTKTNKESFNLEEFYANYHLYAANNDIGPLLTARTESYLSIITSMIGLFDSFHKTFNIIIEYNKNDNVVIVLWYMNILDKDKERFSREFKVACNDVFDESVEEIKDTDYNRKIAVTI